MLQRGPEGPLCLFRRLYESRKAEHRMNSAEAEIRRRIAQRGAITFAEFMELALYWPGGGYYVTGDPTGAQGDFYTGPQVHPVFGTLIAVQLIQMWRLLGQPNPFTVVELGAGNGLLCRDSVTAAGELPSALLSCLNYVCLDRRSGNLIGGQEPSGVNRVVAGGIPFRHLAGCIISNEYFDAFPVHQVTVIDGTLFEIYVTQGNGDLVTLTGALSDSALLARFDDLDLRLEEGQVAEVNLALGSWAQEAAQALDRGFMLTVDYGDRAPELYSPQNRKRGTLTTFYNHTQIDSPLRYVGRQDITAQVDFTSLVNAGRRNGGETLGFASQGQFLGRLGMTSMQQRLRRLDLPQNAAQANRAGMVDLVRPGGLGDFKVLAQGRNVGEPELWGFGQTSAADDEVQNLVNNIPVPLLAGQHLSLPQGLNMSGELEFDLGNLFDGPENG